MVSLDFLKYLRFSTASYLRIFYVFSTVSTRGPLTGVDGQSVGNKAWSGIEVVITGLTRNQLTGNRPWVRIPPAPPRRGKLCIACPDFFQKSGRAHSAAPPFPTKPEGGFAGAPFLLRRVIAAVFFTLRGLPCAGTSRSSPPRTSPGPRSPDGRRCRRWWRRCCDLTRSGSASWGCRCSEAGWRRYALMA